MQTRPHLSHSMILRNLGPGVNAELLLRTKAGAASKWIAGSGQVSSQANYSSNLPARWIDSSRKQRYSLAQIPNLVAYTNPRFGQKAIRPGPATSLAART